MIHMAHMICAIRPKRLEYELFRVFDCQTLTSMSVWILFSEVIYDACNMRHVERFEYS